VTRRPEAHRIVTADDMLDVAVRGGDRGHPKLGGSEGAGRTYTTNRPDQDGEEAGELARVLFLGEC